MTVKKALDTLLAKQSIRYLFVGGLSFLLELMVLACLLYLGFENVTSVAISFWFGLVAAFLLQKSIAFRDRSYSKRRVFKQTVFYMVLVGVNYLFTLWFVEIFDAIFNIFVVRTIALVITTVWNYLIYKYLIFK